MSHPTMNKINKWELLCPQRHRYKDSPPSAMRKSYEQVRENASQTVSCTDFYNTNDVNMQTQLQCHREMLCHDLLRPLLQMIDELHGVKFLRFLTFLA